MITPTGSSRRLLKWSIRRVAAMASFVMFTILLTFAAGGFIYLRSSLPKTSGEVIVNSPRNTVTIGRNENGIPNISAQSIDDAYYGLGFAHAQDRLWQMEFARRAGAGRLAEILGEPALNTDKFIRVLGLYRSAKSSVDHLSEPTRIALEAYAAGINAYLKTHQGALPPEFVLLGYQPEPWSPADSVVVQKIMALRLGRNWVIELLRARIAAALEERDLPPERIFELWPPNDFSEPISIHTATHGFTPVPEIWFDQSDLLVGGASNGWLIHGSRTKTGKPILANDPHLRFEAPINWYLIRIDTPELSGAGATLPGLPFMPFGHNGQMAGGITNGGADVQDLFKEKVDPENAGRYLLPRGSREFETRVETIRIKDVETLSLTVRNTRHGPVISDVHKDAASVLEEDEVLAFASPALAPNDRSLDALYGINRSTNSQEFLKAARLLVAPHLNIFFASVDGDICLISAGRIPIRKGGDGRLIAPGHDGSHDWAGFIPAADLPYECNPASGILVNANNRIVDESYPHLIGADINLPFRALRITELLEAKPVQTVGASKEMQLDILSVPARHLVPLLIKTQTDTVIGRRAIALLKNWDFRMARDRPEPLIYAAWLRSLILTLLSDELGEDLALDYLTEVFSPGPQFVVSAFRENSHWCDDNATAGMRSCDRLLTETLNDTLEQLHADHSGDIETWRWGDVHRATFRHPVLTHIPGVRWLSDFSIPSDGGDGTVSSGELFRRDEAPYAHVDGSGLRAIYDFSDLDKSQFIIATGQSGNVLSRHYNDMTRRWRDGEYLNIPPSSGANLQEVLVLQPGLSQ